MISTINSRGGPLIQPVSPETLPNTEELPTALEFDGWERYPLNLPVSSSIHRNLSVYNSRLTAEKDKLFCVSKSKIEICALPEPSTAAAGPIFIDASALQQILMDQKGFHFRSFTITQKNSWSELSVTEEMLRKLLTFHRVFPDFLNVVHLFGKRNLEPVTSSAGFRMKVTTEAAHNPATYSELCFSLTHVQHRKGHTDTWAVRTMGLYLQYNYKTQACVHIYIQPSVQVRETLLEAIPQGKFNQLSHPDPISLHISYLISAMENWEEYVAYLEKELTQLRKPLLVLSNEQMDNFRASGNMPLNYSDYRKLQRYFRDKILMGMQVLESNLDVILGLQKYLLKLRDLQLIPISGLFTESSEVLAHEECRIKSLQRNLSSILQIVEGSAQMAKTFLELRNDAAIKEYSQDTRRLLTSAEKTRDDALQMLEISQRTKRDSHTMKILAIVAMVYLPATYVAAIFGMNTVHSDFTEKEGRVVSRLIWAKEIWICAVATIGLTGVTMGSWWLSERLTQRKK